VRTRGVGRGFGQAEVQGVPNTLEGSSMSRVVVSSLEMVPDVFAVGRRPSWYRWKAVDVSGMGHLDI
jgi:hypothetical protein